MQQTVKYFTERGSKVFISTLDASKAFDRIDKLSDRNFPRSLICVLCNWYGKLISYLRWNGVLSDLFVVSQGVRQVVCYNPSFSTYMLMI